MESKTRIGWNKHNCDVIRQKEVEVGNDMLLVSDYFFIL